MLRLLALALALAPAARAQTTQPEPDTVRARLVSSFGDCQATTTLAADQKSITYKVLGLGLWERLTSAFGLDASSTCYLTVAIDRPHGWQVALAGLDLEGYAYLGEASSGGVSADILNLGMVPTGMRVSHVIYGPWQRGRFTEQKNFAPQALQYSGCNPAVPTEFIVQLSARFAAAAYEQRYFFDLALPATGPGSQRIRLAWRNCAAH